MLGRLVRAEAPVLGANALQARNAGSLKIVKERMRSVAAIQKITKAMKMVSAAKMKGDQRRMDLGMPFCTPVQALFQRLPCEDKAGPLTILGVTSDKGLCGGVNSVVNKHCRLTILEEEQKGNSVSVKIMGGKGEAGLKRVFGDRFTSSYGEIAKLPWNFVTASIIADRIHQSLPTGLLHPIQSASRLSTTRS